MVSCRSKDVDYTLDDTTLSDGKNVKSATYSEIKLTNSFTKWRDGMVGGNGKIGFITNGSPTSDVITYQNIDYLMPTSADRDDIPTSPISLDEIRQKIYNKEDFTSGVVIDSWGRIAKYHPGMQLRIDSDFEDDDVYDYTRCTNYETAEVGEEFNDGSTVWTRKNFSSRKDNVTITSISNTKHDVSITISIDSISKTDGFGKGSDSGQTDETNIQYKELVADDGSYLAQVAHYPNYSNSTWKNGGYAAVTYVIAVGGERKAIQDDTTDSYNKSGYDAAIEIKNAKSVYLITALDKTKDMGAMSAFASATSYDIVDSLLTKAKGVADKYTSGTFSYKAALKPSAEIQKELFNKATLELDYDAELDSKLNEDLIALQKSASTLSPALSNRVYNQGRYAMICCAGYSMSRLSGMWIGTWDPGWRYIYTMDANVNLQSSGMNTSNLSTFGDGYISFVYNQLDDWEKNAKTIYGIDDAILCPPHADGDRAINDEGGSDYYNNGVKKEGYPFQYWNAGAAWMIQPIYEYYQCYGNKTISTYEGDKDLLEDILIPMLEMNANFWMGLCTPEYYMNSYGDLCYSNGKTSLLDGEKYAIIPSYSPENITGGSYKSTLGVNAAMDISAAKYAFQMAIELENLVKPAGYTTNVAKYEEFLTKLPVYQFTSGAVKEWCANGYDDNNTHRHLSHLYLAWPAFETQSDAALAAAAKQAIVDRDTYSTTMDQTKQSHCWLHKGLIAARLKDSEYTTYTLYTMLHAKYVSQFGTGLLYNSLMTNHDIYGTSNAYCTDSSLGLIGVMNESLLYSNTGVIELLPACPKTWVSGKYTGLRARTQADVSCEWTASSVSYTITSDIAQTLTIKYGSQSKSVTVAAGETVTGTFNK